MRAAAAALAALGLGCGPAAADAPPPDRPGEISFGADGGTAEPSAGIPPDGPCRLMVGRLCESLGDDHEVCLQMRRDLESQGVSAEDEEACLGMLPHLEMLMPLLTAPEE
jgi:hypothetical protein